MKLFSWFKKIGQSLKKPRSTIDALSVLVSLSDLEKIVLKSIDKRSLINVAAEHLNIPVDLLLDQIADRLQVPVAKQIHPVDPATLGGTFAFKKYQEIGAIPLVTDGLLTGICGVDPETCLDLPVSSLPFYLADWARIEKALTESLTSTKNVKTIPDYKSEFDLIQKVLVGVINEVKRYGGKQVTLVNTSKALIYQFETGDLRFAEGEVHQRAIPAFRVVCDQINRNSELSKRLIDTGIVISEKTSRVDGLAELTWYATPELLKRNDSVEIKQEPTELKLNQVKAEEVDNRKQEDQKAIFLLNAAKDNPEKTAVINQTIRILMLEDNPTFAKVLQRFLEKEGYQIDHAKNGDEALGYLRTKDQATYDLIISDVHMPGSNGFDFLHAVRDLDQRHELPIIMLTSDNNIETELKFIGWGVEAFVSKSADPRILGAHVKRVIAKVNDSKLRRDAA